MRAALKTAVSMWAAGLSSRFASPRRTDATKPAASASVFAHAAWFLAEFVGDTPWIHLDIAGLAWIEENKPFIAKGPSGVGVRSILEWVRSYES